MHDLWNNDEILHNNHPGIKGEEIGQGQVHKQPNIYNKIIAYKIWCRKLLVSFSALEDYRFHAYSAISRPRKAASCQKSRRGGYRPEQAARITDKNLTINKGDRYGWDHDVLDMHHRQVEILDIAQRHSCQGKLIDDIRVRCLYFTNQEKNAQDLQSYCPRNVKTVAHCRQSLHISSKLPNHCSEEWH